MSPYLRTCSIFMLCTLVGCGIPPHMRIGTSLDPKQIDKEVRYRTTYYFRSFDYCYNKAAASNNEKITKIIPQSDTLYRYRLTGKANALTTKIHFESGVLNASTIDPFGSKILFDQDGGFYVQSAEETAAKIRKKEALESINLLKALEGGKSVVESTEFQTELKKALVQAMSDYSGLETSDSAPSALFGIDGGQDKISLTKDGDQIKVEVTAIKQTEDTLTFQGKVPENDGETENLSLVPAENKESLVEDSERPDQINCGAGDNLQVRRGYQIMGPEGFVTFDQDDRLILAMSIDGKPLIDVLNQYSSRVLNASAGTADALLPLVQEDLAIARADRERDTQERAEVTPDVKTTFDAVLRAFDEQNASLREGE